MLDYKNTLTFEVTVTEMVPVKSTYFIKAGDMAEALSIVENVQPKLKTKFREVEKNTLVLESPAQNRKVLAASFAHNYNGQIDNNSRPGGLAHSLLLMAVKDKLNAQLDVKVSRYNAHWGVDGIQVGSHRFVVYSEMSEDDTVLNVTISLRSLGAASRFLTPVNRFRPLSPEERTAIGYFRPNEIAEHAPDLVQSFEIFSYDDYYSAVENIANAIIEAKPCAGALDRSAQGQSRVCSKCPYQLACISTKV